MRHFLRMRTVSVKDSRLLLNLRIRKCMSSSSRAVFSFGDDSHGALGLPSSHTGLASDAYEPTLVPGLPSDIAAIAAGHYHSLAITSRGHLWAWGRNNEAQLGRGLLAPRGTWREPKRVEGLDNVKVHAAFASGVVSAALGDDGSLWVWGKSKRGQLGLGKGIIEALVPSRVEALDGEKIAKLSFGWGHCLAQTEDGKLFGWGYSADGRLGRIGGCMKTSPLDRTHRRVDGPKDNQKNFATTAEVAEEQVFDGIEEEKNMPIIWEPSLIEDLCRDEVVDIACGLDHSLILCCDGTLFSGGSNIYGQLGRTNNDLGLLPVDISFRPMSIASGLGHSLAVCQVTSSDVHEAAKGILSWGWNGSSQLGRTGQENLPLMVDGLAEETPISAAGGRVHSIALTSQGEVWVWGCGKSGRLGLGSSCDEVEPILLDSLEGREVLQVATGFDHNLVLVAE